MLTHDSGRCLITHGGQDPHWDGDESDDEPPVQGNLIAPANGFVPANENGADVELENADMVDNYSADEDQEYDSDDGGGLPAHESWLGSMFEGEFNMEEIHNPFPEYPGGKMPLPTVQNKDLVLKNIESLRSYGSARLMFKGEGSGSKLVSKRKIEDKAEDGKKVQKIEEEKVCCAGSPSTLTEEDAVGPEPPSPP